MSDLKPVMGPVKIQAQKVRPKDGWFLKYKVCKSDLRLSFQDMSNGDHFVGRYFFIFFWPGLSPGLFNKPSALLQRQQTPRLILDRRTYFIFSPAD